MQVHQPRMKVFALGLDENQKSVVEKTIDGGDENKDKCKESKIPMPPGGPVPAQIVLAKSPRRRYAFSCNLLSWFVGAFCLILLCLAISEVAYHRQRDQAFLRLKWAELRQRMLGYELLSQQQEIDRMALESSKKSEPQQQQKIQEIESLPLRRSDDPIKPRIEDVIKPIIDVTPATITINEENNNNDDYKEEQSLKFGFLQDLMDKIRKHAESMGLSGDMQVHVVEVKPLGNIKETSDDDSITFDRSIADGFGEFAVPHQDFGGQNDDFDNGRLTFDRHGFKKPRFFGPFNRFENNYYNDYYDEHPRFGNEFQNFPNPSSNFLTDLSMNTDQQLDGFNFPTPFRFRQPFPVPVSVSSEQRVPFIFPPPPPSPVMEQWAQQQPSMEVQMNQWNPNEMIQNQNQQQQQQFFYYPQPQQFPQNFNQQFQQQQEINNNQQRPWYMSQEPAAIEPQQQQQHGWQNDDWMRRSDDSMVPFQPNPQASSQVAPSQWIDQSAQMENSDSLPSVADHAEAPASSVISVDNTPLSQTAEVSKDFNVKAWVQPQNDEVETAPDAQLESIDENKFLPIRSDDKPVDLSEDPTHLFQIDDPSSFRH